MIPRMLIIEVNEKDAIVCHIKQITQACFMQNESIINVFSIRFAI